MYAYSIPPHTYIIIERCLIVCFVFCFSAHSRREESLAHSPLDCAPVPVCSTVDRCLLSNYHKQIRPKPNRDRDRRLTDRRTARQTARTDCCCFTRCWDFNWSAKVAGDATRWEALLLCRHSSYYNIICSYTISTIWRLEFLSSATASEQCCEVLTESA